MIQGTEIAGCILFFNSRFRCRRLFQSSGRNLNRIGHLTIVAIVHKDISVLCRFNQTHAHCIADNRSCIAIMLSHFLISERIHQHEGLHQTELIPTALLHDVAAIDILAKIEMPLQNIANGWHDIVLARRCHYDSVYLILLDDTLIYQMLNALLRVLRDGVSRFALTSRTIVHHLTQHLALPNRKIIIFQFIRIAHYFVG